jgi:Tfp pilus assembly protein PilX
MKANEMHRSGTTRRGRGREAGMTLLLTLGFLCVMLMLVLSLALATRTERRSAAAGADQVRSQLLAQSALGEAETRLRLDYQGVRYPADRFVAPASSSPWAGRRLLGSGGSSAVSAGAAEALAVTLAGCQYTPAAAPAADAGWIPMLSTQTFKTSSGLTQQQVVVGRYTYLVIDDSGKIDPAAVVRTGVTETTSEVAAGVSLAEISLAAVGFSSPDRFLPQTPLTDLVSGQLPATEGRWFSMAHMARALQFTQSEMDLAAQSMFPFSYDQEQFWRDRDEDGVYDRGEEVDRLDVRSSAELGKVYQTLVGPWQDFSGTVGTGVTAGSDDCAWLKKLDQNPWFVAWKNQAFSAYPEPARTNRARSITAAQVAANIVDYADPDSEPTMCYVDEHGEIHTGIGNTPFNLAGTERTWALSQLAMRVDADVTVEPSTSTTTTGDEVAGDNDLPFDIQNGQVIPHVRFVATATVLGCNVQCFNTGVTPAALLYTAPVAVSIELGGVLQMPWGDAADPVAGNINDANNPRYYEVPVGFPAGTPITLNARYWQHPLDHKGRIDYNSWTVAEDLGTNTTPTRVTVLRDGDTAPLRVRQDAARGTLVYYLQEYVENGKISLQPNQAICMFETLAFASPRIPDYQDLAILVTMRPADSETVVNGRTVLFEVAGEVNLNPNNNDHHEFYLTGADASVPPYKTQITRDDLHAKETTEGNRDPYYEGLVSELRIMPKGNGNNNVITLNGVTTELRNGHVYTFTPDVPARVRVWNDKYSSNGRAMGHWWINYIGWTKTAVFEDCNLHYVLTEEEVGGSTTTPPTVTPPSVDPPTDEQRDAVSTDYGNRLRVRTGFRAELYYPWCIDAQLSYRPTSLEVAYKVVVATATGKELVCSGTKSVAVDLAANVDGGTVLWTSDFDMDAWVVQDDAFDTTVQPALTGYTVTQARILQVVVKDEMGKVVDVVPTSPGDLYVFAAAQQATNDMAYFADLTPKDAFMNDRGMTAPDFATFWEVTPADGTLATDPALVATGMGTVQDTYNSGSYAGICVPNSLIQRLGELGRVHSFEPSRSLRLWAASSAAEFGHDGDILDVFKVGSQTQVSGRVNINTLQPAVLKALFTGALDASVDDAVAAVLAKRQAGTTFTTVGEFLGGVAALAPSGQTNDTAAEQVAVRLAEKLTTRSNYFTVILCAQALKDVAGLKYRKTTNQGMTTAAYGKLDVTSAGRLLEPVLAERKLMAVIYRDALTNDTHIERVEYLDD